MVIPALQKLVVFMLVTLVIVVMVVLVILGVGAVITAKPVLGDAILMIKLIVWQQNTKTKILDMNKQIELLKNFFMI